MKRKKYLACCLAMSMMLVSASPMAVSAEAQEDFFYSENIVVPSEDLFVDNNEISDEDDFTSEMQTTDTTSEFNSENVSDDTNTAEAEWTKLSAPNDCIEYKYDVTSQTLYFKSSELAELPGCEQSGKQSEWWEVTNNGQVKKVEIGANITAVNAWDFSNKLDAYPYLEEVVLSDSVTKIGDNAFATTPTLKKINLNSVEKIGQGAFNGTGIENVTLDKNNVEITGSTFAKCHSLTTVNVKGIESMGANSFEDCEKLVSFKCEEPITVIPNYAFKGCTSLATFAVKGIEKVGVQAFYQSTALAVFDFENVSFIDASAFRETSIEKIAFGKAEITFSGKYAFSKCPIKSVCYPGTMEYKCSSNCQNYGCATF